MDVRYYQRTRLSEAEEKELNVTYCSSMDELLACSDIVSPHFPLNKSTTGLIGREQFAKMKDGVLFINTARAAIVDENALIEAIDSGKVARAGLDCHYVEGNAASADTYFTRSDRCFVQPHMGGLTKAAWFKAFREAMVSHPSRHPLKVLVVILRRVHNSTRKPSTDTFIFFKDNIESFFGTGKTISPINEREVLERTGKL